jgi:hypothetical protein
MKYLFFIIILSLLVFIDCYSIDDSTYKSVNLSKDSIARISDNGLNFLAVGGVGMTTRSSFGWWSDDFKNGPIVSLGIEIPFTKSHFWALEIYSHTWFCQIKRDLGYEAEEYNKITNFTYSQTGISAIFKLYLWDANSPFRVSLNLGWLLFTPFKFKNSHYQGIEMGLGLFYKIKDNLALNLTGTTIFGAFDFGGRDLERTPNYVLLKCYYRTNWSF